MAPSPQPATRRLAVALSLALVVGAGGTRSSVGGTARATEYDGNVLVEVSLHNNNMDVIRQRALEASDPRHRLYGQFLSFADVKSLVHRPASLEVVLSHLRRPGAVAGPVSVSADGQRVSFATASARSAEELRRTHADHVAAVVVRQPPVAGAAPRSNDTLYARGIQQQQAGARAAAAAPPSKWPPSPPDSPYLTLHDVKTFYNVSESTAASVPIAGNGSKGVATVAVFEANILEYDGSVVETFNPADLLTFQSLCGLNINPVERFAGDNVTMGCPLYKCTEPMLDVELLRGMAPEANFTYWATNVPDTGDTNTILTWLTRLSALESPSWVHSISWGPPEADMSADIAKRMDEELAKLSARGLTFVASSGDDGVNERTARGDASNCGLSPQYPASSPWVTAVGGTMGPEVSIPERTCETDFGGASITSGGGFSNIWPQAKYQKAAVKAYLANMPAGGLPPSGSFKPTMRAYPDVSLLAHNIDTIVNQAFLPGAGTSASAPMFAGMLALILDSRLSAGKGPFGLVNTALYQLAEAGSPALNDIAVGANRCTGIYGPQQNYTCCPDGFNATAGWDPVTGLGSVNFAELKKALLA